MRLATLVRRSPNVFRHMLGFFCDSWRVSVSSRGVSRSITGGRLSTAGLGVIGGLTGVVWGVVAAAGVTGVAGAAGAAGVAGVAGAAGVVGVATAGLWYVGVSTGLW